MNIERIESITIVSLLDRLNAYTAPHFKELLQPILADKAVEHIIIDLTEIRFMDSAGIAALVSALKRSKEANTKLSIVGLTPSIRIMFDLMRLDKVFSISETVEDAKNRP